MNEKISVLAVVPTLSLSSGGPTETVVGLCESLGKIGVLRDIMCIQSQKSLSKLPDVNYVKTHIHQYYGAKWMLKYYVPGFKKNLSYLVGNNKYNILHCHGIWTYPNHCACNGAIKSKIPLIISPHGMLMERALRIRSFRKFIAWRMYQSEDFRYAHAIHATSHSEAEDIIKLNLKIPIFVIGNGVNLPDNIKRANSTKPIRTALFLGRIHKIKNIESLILAWSKCNPKNWQLNIVGYDEQGLIPEFRNLVQKLGQNDFIKFHGPANETDKKRYFQESSLFILPSYSESFGNVVAEAMSYGLPIITTTGTPWKSIIDNNCGWFVEPDVGSLFTAIEEATKLPENNLLQMGDNGEKYIRTNFNWENISTKMIDVYKWMLGIGEKPNTIIS
jgi:glycosyltransferase involved in cell wall biosynthesis